MPPLPKSISLHVGAHKTASSHLQRVLYQNREMLSEEGIRVYGPGYLRMPGRSLAAMFNMPHSQSPAPRRGPTEQLRFLSKGRKQLVFTEENFVGLLFDKSGKVVLPLYPQAEERISHLVGKWAPVKTDLFVAVRHPTAFMSSAYSQTLFGGAAFGPKTFRARNDWRKLDWAAYVARLRRIDGIGRLYVWQQEDYDQLWRLILRRMLRWKVGARIEALEERVHQGLSNKAVRQTLQWAQHGETGDLARKARSQFPVTEENPIFRLYSDATDRDASAVYAEQLTEIAAMDGVDLLQAPTKA